MKVLSRSLLLSIAIAGASVLFFQNCGPAKISSNLTSMDLSSNGNTASIVGTKVDLASLLTAPNESSSNVFFPFANVTNMSSYSQDCPIIENIVLRTNDFTSIIWVHGPSSTVVASGDSFNQKLFSSDLSGDYYIFGFRGTAPSLIGQFNIISKNSKSIGVNSDGAVKIVQPAVELIGDNESILLMVVAPAVDMASTQFTLKNTGAVINNKRVILISKKSSESVDVEVKLSDTSGQSFTQIITLPANSGATPTPTPTSMATPTPTPTPVPIAAVSISTTLLDFGTINLTSASLPKFVAFTNTGSVAIAFNASVIVNDITSSYSFSSGSCGATLAPAASCAFGVKFSPQKTGTLTGTAKIYTNVPGSPHLIQLTGVGN